MKKNILYIGLVALALQSCDYLDREPLDSISKDKFGSVVILGGLTFVNFPLCIHLC